MQRRKQGSGGGCGDDFAACCAFCLHELRQARRAPHEEGWRGRLAYHRTRLGALLTADAELEGRIAAIGSGRLSDPVEVKTARADALVGEAARRRTLTARERRMEASARRRLTANNLAELRGR